MERSSGRNSKKEKTLIAIGVISMLIGLGGCALSPVETDPDKAAERNAMMRADCYKRGGIWYEDKGVCVATDNGR